MAFLLRAPQGSVDGVSVIWGEGEHGALLERLECFFDTMHGVGLVRAFGVVGE